MADPGRDWPLAISGAIMMDGPKFFNTASGKPFPGRLPRDSKRPADCVPADLPPAQLLDLSLQNRARRLHGCLGDLERAEELLVRHDLPAREGNRGCVEHLVADAHAGVADVDAGATNEPGHVLVGFAAERALQFSSARDRDHVSSSCQGDLDNSNAPAERQAFLDIACPWLFRIGLV